MRGRRRRLVAALAASGLAFVTAACGSSPPSSAIQHAHLGVVADTGFRPSADGLPFQNYGVELSDGSEPANLTIHDLQLLFGNGVCADVAGGRCDLTPEARAWLNDTNAKMNGGHCFGFSLLADLLWERKLRITTLGAATTAGLDIHDNRALQRLIAYDWALQLLDSMQEHKISGTPNEILDRLITVLKRHPSDTYTIAFWKPDLSGGHAVTPYAVVNRGHGIFGVLVYDNNWPGESRTITFNTVKDTWTYDAAVNPDAPKSVYRGDGGTKTLALYPTSAGLGTQHCPFCSEVPKQVTALSRTATEEIYLDGSLSDHANLVISDRAGHRLGVVNGRFVDEISGAHADAIIAGNQDWREKMEPDFFVPANATYTITVDGRGLSQPDVETVGVVGPASDVSVQDIDVQPGEVDTLVVGPDATTVRYESGRAQSLAVVDVGVSDHRAHYDFEVDGLSGRAGNTVDLRLPAEAGTLALDDEGATRASDVNLTLTRSTAAGEQVFSHRAISLAGGNRAVLRFGEWRTSGEGVPFVTYQGGRATTEVLANQAHG